VEVRFKNNRISGNRVVGNRQILELNFKLFRYIPLVFSLLLQLPEHILSSISVEMFATGTLNFSFLKKYPIKFFLKSKIKLSKGKIGILSYL
jgi:hypothetical protein